MCTVSLLFIYALVLISQIDNNLYPSLPHLATWLIGICGESVILAAEILIYQDDVAKHSPSSGGMTSVLKKKFAGIFVVNWDLVGLSIGATRIFLLVLLMALYVVLVVAPKPSALENDSEETTPLLSGTVSPSGSGPEYGANSKNGVPSPDQPAGWARKMTLTKQSWWEYLRGYAIFFPYLWPSKNRRLQVLMVICFVLVILQRVVNVLVPNQLGKIVNILDPNGKPEGEPRREFFEPLLCLSPLTDVSRSPLGTNRDIYLLPLPPGQHGHPRRAAERTVDSDWPILIPGTVYLGV